MLLSLHVYDRVISGDLLSVPAPSRSNSIDDDVLDAVQESEDLPVEQRKHFTFAFACHTPDASHLDKDGFKHELVLLDGHGFVWAWWLHLYHLLSVPAPSRSNNIALRHHLDMGLSATAQIRVGNDSAKLATWSAERAGTNEWTTGGLAPPQPGCSSCSSATLA
jgi:hypothetical protein